MYRLYINGICQGEFASLSAISAYLDAHEVDSTINSVEIKRHE